ncbi:MAG: MFS transporter [Candidatus Bathyarchaeota archaeon]|nr:MFS transporter [Candidatus Bathyarchaeota archaeon]
MRSVVNSLSTGMVNPFMGAYAVKLGASSAEMGWYQLSSNISNNIMQVFWGRLSDKVKRRVPFIIVGTLTMALLWIPMIFVANATQLIILIAIQAILGSMATPALTALIGDLVPSSKLGRANATINLWASTGSLIATIASGWLMVSVGGTPQEIMFLPLVIATLCGITSCLAIVYVKERKSGEKLNLTREFASDFFSMLKYAGKSHTFVKYCAVVGFFEFSMSICWPLIPRTQVDVLGASMLQIALLSVVQSLLTIIFQGWAGRFTDTMGRKQALIIYRFSLITVPIAYAFAPDINALIAIGAFWGIITALGQAGITAYLLDISPSEYRGSFTAVFNLVLGVTSFFGSLIGGYLSAFTIDAFGLIVGLQIVYMVSMVGRIIGAILHLTLKETIKKK